MACLVRRTDLSVAYITKENISRARTRSNVATPRPIPNPGPLPLLVRQPTVSFRRQPSLTNNPGPQPLVRQPSLKPPPRKVPKKALSIGEKRNISKQELKIIIDSLKEIRTKICTIKRKPDKDITDLDYYRYEVFKKQLKELNAKLC